MTCGPVPMSSTGSRSFSVSNGRFEIRNGLMAWLSRQKSHVVPSGDDFATSAAPALPEAHGRLSTMMTLPNRCCRPAWTTRAIMSIEPPAANGTTILIGPDGQEEVCPAAMLAARGVTKLPSRTERRVGMISFRGISSHRQIVVLSFRHLHGLALQHRQRAGDPPPRRVRHDHVVDVAALGGDEGRQEALLVFLGPRRDLFDVADVATEDDLDRPFGAHHGDLRRRPGVVQIAADVL